MDNSNPTPETAFEREMNQVCDMIALPMLRDMVPRTDALIMCQESYRQALTSSVVREMAEALEGIGKTSAEFIVDVPEGICESHNANALEQSLLDGDAALEAYRQACEGKT